MKNKGQKLIHELQKNGLKVFSIQDAEEILKGSRSSILLVLDRLRKKEEVVTIANGLYALLEPSEQAHGIRTKKIIDSLMKHIRVNYYVGLLSAADSLGAAHHKPMVLQVIVDKFVTLRKREKFNIEIHTQKNFLKTELNRIKTSTGYYHISSPCLTALDVINYEKSCGGINNVMQVVHDLKDQITPKDLLDCCKKYKNLSSVQRLGYLLEYFGYDKASLEHLKKYLKEKKVNVVPFYVSGGRKGSTDVSWKVIENHKIEVEI